MYEECPALLQMTRTFWKMEKKMKLFIIVK